MQKKSLTFNPKYCSVDIFSVVLDLTKHCFDGPEIRKSISDQRNEMKMLKNEKRAKETSTSMLNKDLTLSSDSDTETQVDAKANTEVARMGHSRPHTKSIKQKFKTPEYI